MLRRSFVSLLFKCAAAGYLFVSGACTKSEGVLDDGEDDEPDDKGTDGEPDWSAIDSKATVRGVVSCNGVGIRDAIVTDGINMTRTNSQGVYGLRTSSDESRFVYLCIPSGYEVAVKRGFLPDFYREVSETSVSNVQRFDFPLTKVDNDNHIIMLSADMHIMNTVKISSRTESTPDICPEVGDTDAQTFHKYFSPGFNEYVKGLPAGVPVYGINLGDMTNDYTYWKTGADFENYIKVQEEGGMNIPTFHVIGNHDHDKRITNINDDDDSESEQEYMNSFGPTYYSFNIGKVHYVVLDNIKYINTGGNIGYDYHFNQRQMDWIQKDVTYMASNVERVVICEHGASYRNNNSLDAVQYTDNADEMLNVYAAKGVPITLLAGHHHVAQSVVVPGFSVDVAEYLHPAVTGAWWYFPLCADGAPTTFTEYDFNGGELTKRRSYNYTYPDEQYYRVYNEGLTNDEGKPVIRINVWDYSKKWTIECKENGEVVSNSRIQRITMQDPYYSEVHDNTGNGIAACDWLGVANTNHAFEYTPVDSTADIQITFWDECGDKLFVIDTKIA